MKTNFIVALFFVALMSGCKVNQTLPKNAIVRDQVIFYDEVKKGTPQTIQMPNGTTVTYKLPDTVTDGQLIKIKE